MSESARVPSARKEELLERAYRYALTYGLADLSLRPLATAIESSPRVLLFLFGSKEGLIRALLARARTDELELLYRLSSRELPDDLASVLSTTWQWLSDAAHRPILVLWTEAYARSLVEPEGPWADFARQTVDDWLSLFAAAQTASRRKSGRGVAERSLALSVLRGALLDILATGDVKRTSAAIGLHVSHIKSSH